MTRLEVLARVQLELDAWITEDARVVSGDEVDLLEQAVDDACETCRDEIDETPR